MAPKHAIPTDSLSRKRIKREAEVSNPHRATKGSKSKSWKPAKLDSLDWREVTMPDRLDDVEGFMGLEEVDDVQVISDTGIIKYNVCE